MSACGICGANSRAQVDAALAAGRSVREIARSYGHSKSAVARHRKNCKSESARPLAANVAPVSPANEDIAGEIAKLRRAQANARRRNDTTAVLSLSREIRAWVTLQAKAENTALPRPQEEAMTHAEAVACSKVIIEGELTAGSKETISWLLELVERVSTINSTTDSEPALETEQHR